VQPILVDRRHDVDGGPCGRREFTSDRGRETRNALNLARGFC